MTFPTGKQIDVIATKILFDAKEAIDRLRGWQNSVDEGAQRTLLFKEVIKSVAKQMNGDMKAATAAVLQFAKSLGINPVHLKAIGKELETISILAKRMGISFEEAESRFGKFSIMVAQGTGNIVLFGSALHSALASGVPLLTVMQTALMAISTQLSIIKGQMSGFIGGGRGGVPLLGAGGAGAGVPPDFIEGQWREVSDGAGKASKAMGDVESSAKKAGEAGKQAGEKTANGFQRAVSAVNVLRIAMGAIISMLLFRAIQAVTEFFGDAIQQAREYEATLYRIANAERQLSMEGIDVSVKGLKEGIKQIQEALPIFSKEDIAQLIGGIATTTKELGYTEEKTLKLAAAVAILNLNSTESESLLQTMGKVANSLISPQAKSIGNLGLAFGRAKIEAKAFEYQILKTGESFSDLTEKEKQEIKFQIVLETAGIEKIDDIEKLKDIIEEAGGDFEALNEYLASNDAKLSSNAAAWNDLKVAVGQVIIPLLPVLTGAFEAMEGGIAALKVALIEITILAGVAGVGLYMMLTRQVTNLKDFRETIDEFADDAREHLVNVFFKDMPENAPDWFGKWGDLIKEQAETATGAYKKWEDEVADEEALKALEDLEDKIQDIILDAKQAQEDLDIRLEQKREDLDLEYIRKEADAATKHAQKLEDINQDALDKIEDAKRKARETEEKDDQKLLQRLKELREKFLLDLEDALHARDARAVLRLIKEYKLEKQNILDRAALEKEQRKKSLEEDLRDIEIDRQRRIEDAKIEHQRKLADLALAKQREQDELEVWYRREQDDIQKNIKDKLEKLLNGYISEETLHKEHQKAIYDILSKYFGEDMELMGSLTKFMAEQFAAVAAFSQATAAVMGSLNYALNLPNKTNPFAGSLSTNYVQPISPYKKSEWGLAEGGTVIATRPTRAIFGERGPEVATFTPLNRAGKDVDKVFGDIGGGGVNGQIMIAVDLSPDLEGRVVSKSLDSVAEIITRVNRTKL